MGIAGSSPPSSIILTIGKVPSRTAGEIGRDTSLAFNISETSDASSGRAVRRPDGRVSVGKCDWLTPSSAQAFSQS